MARGVLRHVFGGSVVINLKPIPALAAEIVGEGVGNQS